MAQTFKVYPSPPEARIHSTRLHLALYSLLLVATPLVMLRTFLQQAIASLSDLTINVFGWELPLMLSTVTAAGIVLVVWHRRRITWRHGAAVTIVLLMDLVAQQFADYYSDHRFYDLQQNWHYIAYSIFAFMVYRDLAPRGVPLYRIILLTFGLAFVMSTFDEQFQRYINTRVFDISDIAKDTYGAVAGLVLIALGSRRAPEFLADRRLRHPRLRDYFRHPFSALILVGTFSFLLMNTAALLSDADYFFTALGIALAAFFVLWGVLHLSQFRLPRYIMTVLFAAAIMAQGYFYLRYRHEGIVHERFGLTVYRGIPIPYFDLMVRADGSFRLVDKKHQFYEADRHHFMRQKPDILLVASGHRGRGGKGFSSNQPSQFMFNPYSEQGMHVLILNTPDACKTYNRLLQEKKNVLLILHSTC